LGLPAVAAAFAAAALFAGGSALQQRAAGAAAADDQSGIRLVARLARRPAWLIGLVLSAGAFSMHAVALRLGNLALVQPVIVSGIVFAVLVRAGIDRRLPSRREIVWSVVTWAGLALFITVMPPMPDNPPEPKNAAIFVIVVVTGVGLLLALARLLHSDRRRGVLLGAGAGAMFGLVAGLLKLFLTQASSGWINGFLHWSPWALLAVGACAILLNQRAYQVVELSVSAPVLNVVQVIVAIGFGLIVFRERLSETPAILVAELVGLLLIILGVQQLASYHGQAGNPSTKHAESASEASNARQGAS
jgi:multidrug transporter EmrE-like cation transporter